MSSVFKAPLRKLEVLWCTWAREGNLYSDAFDRQMLIGIPCSCLEAELLSSEERRSAGEVRRRSGGELERSGIG